ncbi:MAG: hypothetical protein IJC59_03035, partial [Lachnospiraceae bacterium]|nr:hypothetical protein [Lachnospiraceae bacterium]
MGTELSTLGTKGTDEKKTVSRKDMIKNLAIIFLGLMLVLTFFSNTIMNYSLPEVATDTVQPGSITAKIRGTGTIASDDPYQVSVQESRVISGVAVKQGDTVEKDQVLFYLEDKESAELEAAKKELDALILAYTTELLKGQVSDQTYDNIQSGNVSSTNAYQARIEAAKQKVDAAQATVDSLTNQIAAAGVTDTAKIDKQTQLAQAQANAEAAGRRVEAAEGAVGTAQAAVENAKAAYAAAAGAWGNYVQSQEADGHTKDIEFLKGFLDKLFDDVNTDNAVQDPDEKITLAPCTEGEDINTYKA